MQKKNIDHTNTPVIAMLASIENLIKLDRFYCNAMNAPHFTSGNINSIIRTGDSMEIVTIIVVICRSLLECYIKFLNQKDNKIDNSILNKFENENLNLFCQNQKELRDALVHGQHNSKTEINKFPIDDYNGEMSKIMSNILKNTKHKDESYSDQMIYCTFELIIHLNDKHLIKDNNKIKHNELIIDRIYSLKENCLNLQLF